ncbi:MAG: hypothetical protein ACW981_03445 [Candidatus Hodarchaeales archaeon]|jgi:hypothetical protein
MNTSIVELSNISDSNFVKSFRNIISRIGKGYSYKVSESSAGYQLRAVSDLKTSNLPDIRLILNFLGEIITVRFEATGNLSHYVIEEVMLKVFPNLNPIEIELTELETGRIRITLNKKKYPSKKLYPIFKREFFSYYANDEGRLLILLDNEPDPTSSIAVSADPLKIRPKTSTYATRPPQISLQKGKKLPNAIPDPIQSEQEELLVEDSKEKFSERAEIIEDEISVSEQVEISEETHITDKESLLSEKIEEKETKIVSRGRKKKKSRTVKSKDREIIVEKENQIMTEKTEEFVQPDLQEYDLTKNEKLVLDLIDAKPKRKVQSKGLKKELPSLEQLEIKEILRSLVLKGYLYVEAAWYLRKQPDEVIEKKSGVPLTERLKRLNAKERKVFDILNRREGNKAQARMLIRPTKMSKDNLKKILRDMVAKDVLFVEAAWYIVKTN